MYVYVYKYTYIRTYPIISWSLLRSLLVFSNTVCPFSSSFSTPRFSFPAEFSSSCVEFPKFRAEIDPFFWVKKSAPILAVSEVFRAEIAPFRARFAPFESGLGSILLRCGCVCVCCADLHTSLIGIIALFSTVLWSDMIPWCMYVFMVSWRACIHMQVYIYTYIHLCM